MSLADISIIVDARNRIMATHGITSEAALNLLVSLATADGATVLSVARVICSPAEVEVGTIQPSGSTIEPSGSTIEPSDDTLEPPADPHGLEVPA